NHVFAFSGNSDGLQGVKYILFLHFHRENSILNVLLRIILKYKYKGKLHITKPYPLNLSMKVIDIIMVRDCVGKERKINMEKQGRSGRKASKCFGCRCFLPKRNINRVLNLG